MNLYKLHFKFILPSQNKKEKEKEISAVTTYKKKKKKGVIRKWMLRVSHGQKVGEKQRID